MAHTPVAPLRARREPGEVFGAGFTLFADMLLVGLLTSLACLPVVTAPAAFGAASAVLRSSAEHGPQVKTGAYVAALRERLSLRTLTAGLVPPLAGVLLLVDSRLVHTALPGALAMTWALVVLTLGAATVALRTVALTAPHRLSAREGLLRALADPRGSLLLGGAVLLALLLVWAIPMLLPLLPGPLAFAATAVDVRYTAGRQDD